MCPKVILFKIKFNLNLKIRCKNYDFDFDEFGEKTKKNNETVITAMSLYSGFEYIKNNYSAKVAKLPFKNDIKLLSRIMNVIRKYNMTRINKNHIEAQEMVSILKELNFECSDNVSILNGIFTPDIVFFSEKVKIKVKIKL